MVRQTDGQFDYYMFLFGGHKKWTKTMDKSLITPLMLKGRKLFHNTQTRLGEITPPVTACGMASYFSNHTLWHGFSLQQSQLVAWLLTPVVTACCMATGNLKIKKCFLFKSYLQHYRLLHFHSKHQKLDMFLDCFHSVYNQADMSNLQFDHHLILLLFHTMDLVNHHTLEINQSFSVRHCA